MKLGLWIGAPSLLAFLGMVYSQVLENIHLIFILSVAALIVAIAPRLSEIKTKR